MENLSIRKVKRIREAIEAVRAELWYLDPGGQRRRWRG
jgi:hypothetical protein